MRVTVDQEVDLEEEHAVMLSFGVPSDVLREVTRERDEARDLLRQVAVALGCPDQAPGDLPSSVEAFLAQRDRMRAERDDALALVERVRPVVKALAVAYDTEASVPEYSRNWLPHLMNALERRFTTYAADAAWLRSLLAPQPQDDR